MRKQKYFLAIDDYEHSIIINSLNNLRNTLIADGNLKHRHGISSYKKAEQNSMPVCCMKIYDVKAVYYIHRYSKPWKVDYKMGKSITKGDFHIQNVRFVLQMGISCCNSSRTEIFKLFIRNFLRIIEVLLSKTVDKMLIFLYTTIVLLKSF